LFGGVELGDDGAVEVVGYGHEHAYVYGHFFEVGVDEAFGGEGLIKIAALEGRGEQCGLSGLIALRLLDL
jgi:hypothetical protein